MKRTHRNFKNRTSAFTLVETLVAISILMIALASPMVLAEKGITAAELSKDQMTASFLAQDGIEAVKNIRDQVAVSAPADNSTTDWLSGSSTAPTGLANCICTGNACDLDNLSGAKYCSIDTTHQNLTDGLAVVPGTQATANLKETTVDGTNNGVFMKYDLSGNITSKFSRYITIQMIGTEEAKVHVRVSWTSTLGMQNIDINDFLYNYAENIK